MKLRGLIGGVSPGSTAIHYRLLNERETDLPGFDRTAIRAAAATDFAMRSAQR